MPQRHRGWSGPTASRDLHPTPPTLHSRTTTDSLAGRGLRPKPLATKFLAAEQWPVLTKDLPHSHNQSKAPGRRQPIAGIVSSDIGQRRLPKEVRVGLRCSYLTLDS